jgi:hypothetical protein
MPTALTNGSAKGSLINGSGLRVATARAAATIVAVAPTLDARSHVSLSARLMLGPSIMVARLSSSSPAFLGALINPRYLANDSRSSDGAAFVPHT